MTDTPADLLFFDIGTAISENTLGLKPTSKEEVVRLGEKWFNSATATIQHHLCTDDMKCRIQGKKDHIELVTTIADVLLACSFPSYIPMLSVARLCMHIGVGTLCGWTH